MSSFTIGFLLTFSWWLVWCGFIDLKCCLSSYVDATNNQRKSLPKEGLLLVRVYLEQLDFSNESVWYLDALPIVVCELRPPSVGGSSWLRLIHHHNGFVGTRGSVKALHCFTLEVVVALRADCVFLIEEAEASSHACALCWLGPEHASKAAQTVGVVHGIYE